MCYLLGNEPQSMRWGLVLGVKGNLRKVLGMLLLLSHFSRVRLCATP